MYFSFVSGSNIYCGALQCEHLNKHLEFGKLFPNNFSRSSVYGMGDRTLHCWTANVELGLNDVDPGLVPDGSKCGEGKVGP